jgi:hypothetical protein
MNWLFDNPIETQFFIFLKEKQNPTQQLWKNKNHPTLV